VNPQPDPDLGPQCDCGYRGQGDTIQERVRDAQRHAREAHGIDVTADQILQEGQTLAKGQPT
jgi:predicted small metal-binding protein